MNEWLKLIQANSSYETVLFYTCLINFKSTKLFLLEVEQTATDNTMESYLKYIKYKIHYKLWLLGHFYQYRKYPKEITAPNFQNPHQVMWYIVIK